MRKAPSRAACVAITVETNGKDTKIQKSVTRDSKDSQVLRRDRRVRMFNLHSQTAFYNAIPPFINDRILTCFPFLSIVRICLIRVGKYVCRVCAFVTQQRTFLIHGLAVVDIVAAEPQRRELA